MKRFYYAKIALTNLKKKQTDLFSVSSDLHCNDNDELYGEYQAGEDAESRGPLTNFTFEDAEPSIVTERG